MNFKKVSKKNLFITIGLITSALLLFQNFRWLDLLRGGPGNELFEAQFLDSQVDWLASVADTRAELRASFDQTNNHLQQSILGLSSTLNMNDPHIQASAFVVAAVKKYMERIIARERKADLEPTFYYAQDGQYFTGQIPTTPFKIEFATFDQKNNLLEKGNEELIKEIREWRWESMYRKRYIDRGGSPLVMLRLYADPTPLLKQTKALVNSLNINSVPTYLKLAGTQINPLTTSISSQTSAEAQKVKDLSLAATRALNRFTLFLFLSRTASSYQTMIDSTLAEYQLLGVDDLQKFIAANPNAYNGEDIDPVLFDYSLVPIIGNAEENAGGTGEVFVENISTVQFLQQQKQLLERDYRSTALSTQISLMRNCAALHNQFISSAATNAATLATFVNANLQTLSSAATACRSVARPSNEMFFLSRLPTLNFTHKLYLKYALKQKAIEDKYKAMRAAIAGSEMSTMIDMIEAQAATIDKETMMIPLLDSRYYRAPSKMNDFKADDYQPGMKYRPQETLIDLPSTLRRLAIQGASGVDPVVLRGLDTSPVRKLLQTYSQINSCKKLLEDTLEVRIKEFYETQSWSKLDWMIDTLKMSDPSTFCLGGFYGEEGIRSPLAPYHRELQGGGELVEDPYKNGEKAFEIYVTSRAELEKAFRNIINKVNGRVLEKPARPGRTLGSYFSLPCEKAVLPWRKNSNFSMPDWEDLGFLPTETLATKKALNPSCFGIEGGILFPYRVPTACLGGFGACSYDERRALEAAVYLRSIYKSGGF